MRCLEYFLRFVFAVFLIRRLEYFLMRCLQFFWWDVCIIFDEMFAVFCSNIAVGQFVFHWKFCWGSFRSYVAHMPVQKLWSSCVFSSISLEALTQRYVCSPTGQWRQSSHYKQLWMKDGAFWIRLGSSEAVSLLAAADDVWGEHHLTNSSKVTFTSAI